MDDTKPWWEPFDLAAGKTAECVIGPLTVFLYRAADAWLVKAVNGDETESGATVCRRAGTGEAGPEGATRFAFAETPSIVALMPLLADRPVVVRPRTPVSIPPGERATFYISTPVWVSVEVGAARLALCKFSGVRMSDTWFGPNTREGDLCYSTPTHARSRLDEVPRRPHRVVTPVEVRNESSEMLPVDKLSLPVPQLSVYGAHDGSLWTQAVTFVHRAKDAFAELKISEHIPAVSARLVSGPRVEPERGGLVRAFSGIFGRGDE